MSSITQIGIWERLVQPEEPDMAPDVARQFLKMRFPPEDLDRMNGLAEKARHGMLRPDKKAEIEEYLLAGGILELIQAKARLVLADADDSANPHECGDQPAELLREVNFVMPEKPTYVDH